MGLRLRSSTACFLRVPLTDVLITGVSASNATAVTPVAASDPVNMQGGDGTCPTATTAPAARVLVGSVSLLRRLDTTESLVVFLAVATVACSTSSSGSGVGAALLQAQLAAFNMSAAAGGPAFSDFLTAAAEASHVPINGVVAHGAVLGPAAAIAASQGGAAPAASPAASGPPLAIIVGAAAGGAILLVAAAVAVVVVMRRRKAGVAAAVGATAAASTGTGSSSGTFTGNNPLRASRGSGSRGRSVPAPADPGSRPPAHRVKTQFGQQQAPRPQALQGGVAATGGGEVTTQHNPMHLSEPRAPAQAASAPSARGGGGGAALDSSLSAATPLRA